MSDEKEKKSELSEVLDVIGKQANALTELVMRITVMEKILMEKGLITQEELVEKLKEVGEEITQMIRKAMAAAAVTGQPKPPQE